MTTTHSTLQWTAGDDWQINATLQDENCNPFDLTSATVKWVLMTSGFLRALDENDVGITVTDAVAGKVTIMVPADKTSPLPEDRYTDVIRIIIGGITSTLSYGPILVAADPWIQPKVAVIARTYTPLRRVA